MGSCGYAMSQKTTADDSPDSPLACNTLALKNSSLMADVAQKLSSLHSTLSRQYGIINTQKTGYPVRSTVSTIETPTHGVKKTWRGSTQKTSG